MLQQHIPHTDSTNHLAEAPFFNLKEKTEYNGAHPPYYNAEAFGWVSTIEQGYGIIKEELLAYYESGREIKGISGTMPPQVSKPGAWKTFYFSNFLWMHYGNCLRFPKTWALLQQVPGITFGAVAVLEGGGSVLPHCSESNFNLRCHLGISIPAALPECGIMVDGIPKPWQEGKVLMFSDCNKHSVWNNTDQRRIIVAFDIVKPEFARFNKRWLCARYLGALSHRFVFSKSKVLDKLPEVVQRVSHQALSAVWFLYLPLQHFVIRLRQG